MLKTSVVFKKTFAIVTFAAVLLQLAVWPAAAAPQVSSFSLLGNQPAAVTAKLHTVGTPDLSRTVTLAIGLKLPNPDGLRATVAAIKSGRASALTPQQFLNTYAPTAGDYQAVVSWLTAQGLSVQTSPNRLLVFATGSLGQAASAFKVTTANYSINGRTCYANTTAPQIPLSLSGIIQSVAGLDNIDYFHALSHKAKAAAKPLPAGVPSVAYTVYQGDNGITPLGLEKAYDLLPVYGSVYGTGQTIDIVIWNALDPNDVETFDNTYGLPTATVNQISVGGTPAIDYTNGSAEATLDVEMAHTVAPGATINVYEGVDDDYSTLEEAVNEAIVQHGSNNSNVLSMGWGTSEWSNYNNANYGYYDVLPEAYLATMDAIFAQGAAEGMTMTAASGDNGEWSGNDLTLGYSPPALSVEYPASDPYVTGVGGTDLSIAPDGSYNGETVWNDTLGDGYNPADSSGSTGGFSDEFLAPSWQQPTVDDYVYNGAGTDYNSAGSRGVPDVALNAAEDTATYIDGSWSPYGGTSIGAPSWAGMVALVDQEFALKNQSPLGYLNPLLYQIGKSSSYSSVFNQVYTGDNDTLSTSTAPYYAAYGWNPATGWGSPKFQNLFNYLTSLPPASLPPSITANPTALTLDYAAGTLITISGVNTHFTSGNATVSLTDSSNNEYVKAGSVSIISATKLTFQLIAGLGQPYGGEGNIEVSDTADGSMTASINIGSETATIIPSSLAVGYSNTTINITGDNSDFTEYVDPSDASQDEHIVVQVVNAATQSPAINLGVSQTVYATVTDTTHASFTLPAGLGVGQYDVVVNDTAGDVSMSIPLAVSQANTLTLIATGTSLPAGILNSTYASQAITTYVTASGGSGTYSYSVAGLPNGLTFIGGKITGTPTAIFSGNVTVTVTDSSTPTAQTASVTLILAVISSAGGGGGGGGGGSSAPALTPSLQTGAATSVTATSAVLNGDVTSDNGYTVTDYGFLWGTSASSLTDKLDVGTDNHSGTYTDTLSNLTAGTTYYFEAYATNSYGTAEGSILSFTTTGTSQPTTPTTPGAPMFSDVPTSYWAYGAISNLSSLGYISGYPDGSFKPGNAISRAEFVSIIDRAMKLPAYKPATPNFSDVSTSAWFYGSVERAVYAGIIKGYGNSVFGPNDPITREDLAIILVNALGKQGEAGASISVKTSFTDDHLISSWARGDVVVAAEYGLLKGYPDSSVEPLGNVTRAEACAMVWNYLGLDNQ